MEGVKADFENVEIPESIDLNTTDDELKLDKDLDSVKVDLAVELPPPPTVLFYDGDVIGDLKMFTLIIGKAKSRKSFFVAILAAASVKNGTVLNFEARLPENKNQVLYFDTEQSDYQVQRAMKRVCRLAQVDNPDNLHAYYLRQFKPSERLEMIKRKVQSHQNVGIVFIDGVRDLITSINDEDDATGIATELMNWTQQLQIHVVVVLHQNKGDGHARGHIGSELVNKAQTVLEVAKDTHDKDVSVVKASFARDKEPEPFAFRIDETATPIEATDWTETNTNTKKKISFHDIGDSKVYKVLESVYELKTEFGHGELKANIQAVYMELVGSKLPNNDAVAFMTYCKRKGWLSQVADRKPWTLSPFDSKGVNLSATDL